MKIQKNIASLYFFIPSLYFLEGLHYSILTSLSIVFYKTFQFSNTKIAIYASLFTLPFLLKPLITPLIEKRWKKRNSILFLTSMLSISFGLLIFSLFFENFFVLSAIIFMMVALIAPIYDVYVDGLYLTQLTSHAQAYFIGIRTLCYHLGKLFSQGFLIFLAGIFLSYYGLQQGWQITFLILTLFSFALFFYHYLFLAKHENDNAKQIDKFYPWQHYYSVYRAFITLPNCLWIVFFIFIYHFSEYQLNVILPLFLLDSKDQGGVGLSISDVSILTGMIGVVGLLIGILTSGKLLTQFSLRTCFLPITIFISVTHLGYLAISLFSIHHMVTIGAIIFIAQFSFGLGNGIYMYYLLRCFGKGAYPMSLYAIGTALMSLGASSSGAMSGYMQYLLGYHGFFIWIIFVSIVTIIFSWYFSKKEIL